MNTKLLFSGMRAEMYRNYGTHVVIKSENPRFWKTLDILLRIVSLGRCKNFMQCTTTIGTTVAFPVGTNLHEATMDNLITLYHEREHVKQFDRYGVILMAFLYLFFPLPMGLAYFRYKFERDAYLKSHAFAQSHGLSPNIEYYAEILSGPEYCWAWPKKRVLAWFEKNTKGPSPN